MTVRIALALALALFAAAAGPAAAQRNPGPGEPSARAPGPPSRVSNLPVPRFVSLKFGDIVARQGPGPDHAALWRYTRESLPVEVIAESETYRRIRDHDGDVSWVKATQLDGERTALVLGSFAQPVFAQADTASPVIATAEPRLIARLKRCQGAWCEIEAQGTTGFMPRAALWGVYPEEEID